MRRFALLLILVAVPATGQIVGQASLEAIVTDPHKAVVPGATVSASADGTSTEFQATSNSSGIAVFATLPPGDYRITIRASGFANAEVQDLHLAIGERLTVPVQLTLATASESINISTIIPLIEQARSQASTVVDNRSVQALPVNGRDFARFVLLTPGVTRDVRGGLSFGGQRSMNSLLLDGANQDDSFFGQPVGATGFSSDGKSPYYLSIDAVQEFQVNTNAYSAEFGRAGGGVVNAITKSGTNQWHGTAFWYFRDHGLNANDPINKLNGAPKSPYHFHQFGGSLGGPIQRDRLFFFANYEGLRSDVSNTVVLNLPKGFKLSSNPATAAFQQTALNYLTDRAQSWSVPVRQHDATARLDWRAAQNDQLTLRWTHQRFTGANASDATPQNSLEHSTRVVWKTDSISAWLTSALGRKANLIRFDFLHSANPVDPNSNVPEARVFEQGVSVLLVGRILNRPQTPSIRRFAVGETLRWVAGAHAIAVGGDLLMNETDFFSAQSFSGAFRFNSLESFGRSLRGIAGLQNTGDTFQQAFSGFGTPGVLTHPNDTNISAFVQDEWHLRRELVLNLGLRYDLQLLAQPPVRNSAANLLAARVDTTALPLDYRELAPRLGFAWAPGSGQRVVVRGGYGLFFAVTPSVLTSRAHFQNGISSQLRSFNGPLIGFIPAYPNNFCGAADPGGKPPSCGAPQAGAGSGSLLMFFSNDYSPPRVHQASLSVETRLGSSSTIEVSYLFSHGTHLPQVRDMNLNPPSAATIGVALAGERLTYRQYPASRPVAGFAGLLAFHGDADSIYHGGSVQFSRQFSRGFQLRTNYTWSKVLDNNPNVYAVTPTADDAMRPYDPLDPRGERSVGDNDQRHRFVLAGIWGLTPHPSRYYGLNAILSRWQLTGILTAQSGQPYSALINSFDLNGDGDTANERVPGSARNAYRLPATISLDPQVSKAFALREHFTLKLIGEAFNVLNHTNITAVRTPKYRVSSAAADCATIGAPCLVPLTGLSAFGTPVTSSGPRIIQVAVRVEF